jgi:CHASE2 domain-containing sensor protein
MEIRSLQYRGHPWLLQGLLACLLGFAVFALSSHFGWFAQFDRKLYDVGLNLKESPAAEPECVVIAVDSVTVADWRSPELPISRHLDSHARMVNSLASAGVRLICFDILFDRLDSAGSSGIEAFSEACQSAGNVVLASAMENTSPASGHYAAVQRLLLPHPTLLKSAVGVGLVDAPIDSDGKIRSAAIASHFQDTILGSFCAVAARLSDTQIKVDWLDERSFLIDYSWLSRIPIISYRDVLARPEALLLLRGKTALIGSTLSDGVDNYHIPLNSPTGVPRIESGVFIHAAAVQTLLAGKIVRPIRPLPCTLLFFLLSGLLATLGAGRSVWISVAAYSVVLVAIPVLTVLAVPYLLLVLPAGTMLLGLAATLSAQGILGITVLRRVTSTQRAVITDFKADMQSARQIQQHLQPAAAPRNQSSDIAVCQLTCKEVGGDYYDFVEFGDTRLGILIGDVSGKGVSASLIMSNVQAIFREEAPKHESPSIVLSIINTRLNSISTASGRFISLFYGILDSSTNKLTFSNAGHCNPIISERNGKSRILTEGGTFLGPFASMEWSDSVAQLSPGDLLCLYTDGVSEAGVNVSNQFGEDGILRSLQERSTTSQEALDRLLQSCREFVKNRPFEDDWTAVILRIGK